MGKLPMASRSAKQLLKKARQDRWIANSECGAVIVDVKATRAMVEEMIDMGFLLEGESEKRTEIAKAFITEHEDLVALSQNGHVRELLKELKLRRV
jgi:hypothetical protein